MQNGEMPSYYAIITADVRYDKNLSASEKLLYAEITALSSKNGYCWATDNYFSELYGVSKRNIQRWLSSLEKCGYIKRAVERDGKQITKRYITISDKIVSTPSDKIVSTPSDKIVSTPSDKIVRENSINNNNTSSNNTSNNIPITELDINSNKDNKTSAYQKVVGMFENNGFGSVGGIIATNINDELDDFVQDDNYEQAGEVLCKAIEISVNQGKNKPAYVWGITKNWYQKKLFTLSAIEAEMKKKDFSGSYKPEKKKLKNGGYGTR